MIRRPTNWNDVKEFSDRQKLPLGAYVCKVKKAVVQETEWGEQLCILFDIAEGDYSGFFNNEFNTNTNPDKKWKGVLKQWLPKDNGTEKDEWTKSSLKGMITAFEKSNAGYHWDWNEASLTGRLIGILFRNEEWEYEGKSGWAVRPFRAISVDGVREKTFTLPKDKTLKKESMASGYVNTPVPGSYGFTDITSDDIPF